MTFDQYIKDMMISFGGSRGSVVKMWNSILVNDDSASIKSRKVSLAHFAEDSIRRQLLPGDGGRLSEVQGKLLDTLHESLTTRSLAKAAVAQASRNSPQKISLLEWTRSCLLEGATTAFFGPKLLELEPDLFKSFFNFDDLSWKLLYKIPAPWSNDMISAKAPAQAAITRYFLLPKHERPGCCWLFTTLEDKMKAQGIEEADIAAYVIMMYWVYVHPYLASLATQ